MTDQAIGPFIVTTDDGRMFHCSVAPDERADDAYWVLRDTRGTRYTGPRVSHERTPDAVRGLVNAWWADQRNAG